MAEKSHPPDKNSVDSGHLVSNGSELSELAEEGHSLGAASGAEGGEYSSALGNGTSALEEFNMVEHPTEGDEACLMTGTTHSSLHKGYMKPSTHPNTGPASYPEQPRLDLAEDFPRLGAPFSNSISGDTILPTYGNSMACEGQDSVSSDSSLPMNEEERFSAAVNERKFAPHKSELVGSAAALRAENLETFKRKLEDNDQTTIFSNLEAINFRRSEREVLRLMQKLLVSQQQQFQQEHKLLVSQQHLDALVRELKVAVKAMNKDYRLDVARLKEKYEADINRLKVELNSAKTEGEKKDIEIAILRKELQKARHLRYLEEACHKAEHDAIMALCL